jgi:hypothetical protein
MYLIGLDWSEKEHMVCILDEDGRHLALFSIAHSPDGFARLEAEARKLGATPEQCLVAVETAHNLIIDFLMEPQLHRLHHPAQGGDPLSGSPPPKPLPQR